MLACALPMWDFLSPLSNDNGRDITIPLTENSNSYFCPILDLYVVLLDCVYVPHH